MPKTFTIQIVAPVCPVALPQTVTVTEGQSVDIMLTADNAAGAAWAVSSPSLHGALSGTAPAPTYTPAPTYCGPDSSTFMVSKAGCPVSEAVVFITVRCLNTCPTAHASRAALQAVGRHLHGHLYRTNECPGDVRRLLLQRC